MSSSQTPYIGSKISLISKLDIRYEGTLYTVDTNDATIALAKVRSFGTEKRPTTNPVAARDDVYEYIIFKASDIKDLIVCDTPKMVSIGAGISSDPAIISVSSRSAPASADVSAIGPPSPDSPLAKILTQRPGRGRHQNFQLNFNNYRTGGYNSQRGYNNYGVPRVNNREKLTFDSDFDFEKANEKFQEVTDNLGKLVVTEDEHPKDDDKKDDPCYDKKSSFFDNISCEALEQAAGKTGRPDWNKERETNQETFGHNTVRSLNYRRGFGGRGYGSYNGYGGYNNGYQHRGGYNGGYRQNYGGYRRNTYITDNNQNNNTAIAGN